MACCSWTGVGHVWLQDHHLLIVHSVQWPYSNVCLVVDFSINSGNEKGICKAERSDCSGTAIGAAFLSDNREGWVCSSAAARLA